MASVNSGSVIPATDHAESGDVSPPRVPPPPAHPLRAGPAPGARAGPAGVPPAGGHGGPAGGPGGRPEGAGALPCALCHRHHSWMRMALWLLMLVACMLDATLDTEVGGCQQPLTLTHI